MFILPQGKALLTVVALAICITACCEPSLPPAQSPEAEPAAEPDAAPPAQDSHAASGVIAGIDVFGSKEVSRQDVLETAGLKEGDEVDWSDPAFGQQIEDAKQRLKQTHGFLHVYVSFKATLSGTEAGKVYLTMNLVDPGDEARLAFAPEPEGNPPDPDGLVASWIEYEHKAFALVAAGELDFSEGPRCSGGFFCVFGFAHAELEAFEPRFIEQVPVHFEALGLVLCEHADPEKRAAAALLLAYGPSRQAVADALVPSIDDPASGVRNAVLEVLTRLQEDADAPLLPLDRLLVALRFPETIAAGNALAALLEKAKPTDRFDEMKKRVIDECGDFLVELVGLEQPDNHDPARRVLEALTGEEHGRDQEAWRRAMAPGS